MKTTIKGRVSFASYPYRQFARIYVTPPPPGSAEVDTGIVVEAVPGSTVGTFSYTADGPGEYTFRAEALSGSHVVGGSSTATIEVAPIADTSEAKLVAYRALEMAQTLRALFGAASATSTATTDQTARDLAQVALGVAQAARALAGAATSDSTADQTARDLAQTALGIAQTARALASAAAAGASLTVSEGDATKTESVSPVTKIIVRGGRAKQLSAGQAELSTSTALLQAEWIYALYNGALARDPTGPEFSAADGALLAVNASGASFLAQMQSQAQAVFNLAEYVALARSDDEFIDDLYDGMFGRFADSAGQAYWLAELISQGGTQTRAQIISAFAVAREFRFRAFSVFGWYPDADVQEIQRALQLATAALGMAQQARALSHAAVATSATDVLTCQGFM